MKAICFKKPINPFRRKQILRKLLKWMNEDPIKFNSESDGN